MLVHLHVYKHDNMHTRVRDNMYVETLVSIWTLSRVCIYRPQRKCCRFRPAHEILVLIAYVQISPSNVHADVSSGVKGVPFGLSYHPMFRMRTGSTLVRLRGCTCSSES